MHIKHVVSISVDEEYWYIEVGITLYCSTIKIDRDLDIKVVYHEGSMEVIVHEPYVEE